ncbi:hypothetical protein [Cognatishimia sp. MH4019]|uniref:hypothetical protein n=1 Tax=Cognatishimia sp. MH4019 TaxID=2854030 RepID=UPI001CD5A1D7|nr:hypothetical protein [Cognatishimia sp. MH4019]
MAIAVYALLHRDAYATDLIRIVRYVLAPLGIAAALLAAGFWLERDGALMTGICALSLMIALFMFELLLTQRSFQGAAGLSGFVAGQGTPDAAFRQTMPPAYTLNQLNHALGIKTSENAILEGVPNATVLLCAAHGAPVSYVADQYGFRNPPMIYNDEIDLMILGDSFAEGICLPDGQDVVSRIRADRPGTMNTGSRGAGPQMEVAILRRWGPKFTPDQVVMMFFEGNDWQNMNLQATAPYLASAMEASLPAGRPEDVMTRHARSADVIDGWWEASVESADGFLARRAWVRNFLALQQTALVLGLHYPKASAPRPEYAQTLEIARDAVQGWGGELYVAYIPQVDRFVGLLPNAAAFDDLRGHVEKATKQLGVAFIDLTPAFEAHPQPRSLYAPDAHFSALGAQVAADHILKHLAH